MFRQFDWNDPDLKDIWQKFYKSNEYIFPFSSWEYNYEVHKYKKVKPQTLLQKDVFLVYYNEANEPLIIIPAFIKKGCIYIFGENISGPDNLDFIYSNFAHLKPL